WRVPARDVEHAPGCGRKSARLDLLLFHCALQRMLMLAGEIHDLRHFGLRHLIGIDTAHPDTLLMNVKHYARRFLSWLVEEAFQHMHDELHRRVVVVEQQDLVHAGLLGARPGARDATDFALALPAVPVAILVIR